MAVHHLSPATSSLCQAGKNVIVSGWGALTEGGYGPSILNVAYVPLISNQDCQERYQTYGATVTEDEFCAGFPEGNRGKKIEWS